MNKGTEEDFEDLGMRLKKNNVNLDVINFANPDNIGRLEAMVNAVNGGSDESHFLDVPQGCMHITDVMITSPILRPDENMGGAGDAGGAGGNPDDPLAAMSYDPSLDPELAMALRLSLEEANQAQAQNAPAEAEPAANV